MGEISTNKISQQSNYTSISKKQKLTEKVNNYVQELNQIKRFDPFEDKFTELSDFIFNKALDH
ncbi:MAG: hypothetical protein HRT47_14055 [Candidatus Caenarcaniphilales bacterium]|nr:hypothetical protein [Candidatus Caenarcaniphilales bacterium]